MEIHHDWLPIEAPKNLVPATRSSRFQSFPTYRANALHIGDPRVDNMHSLPLRISTRQWSVVHLNSRVSSVTGMRFTCKDERGSWLIVTEEKVGIDFRLLNRDRSTPYYRK